MPLLDHLTYSAGFVPSQDAAAQQRCYEYLVATIKSLDDRLSHEESRNLANLRAIFEDVRSVTETASGSMRLHRANTFWRYWDRNKVRIISVKEGTDDDYEIQDKLSELEEGRYIQD